MTEKIERILYFLILIFLPTQFGKHFWPPFSFVDGIRVDYLSPTLYFSDLIIASLFLVTVTRLFEKKYLFWKAVLTSRASVIFLVLVIGILIISVLGSKVPLSAWYELGKLFELLFLGFYTASILPRKDVQKIFLVFSTDAIIVSIIAFIQFFRQSSVGGLLYFLGERTFNASTIGIANMNINGTLIMRPYSVFPHPNVLAFYLFVSGLFSLQRILFEKQKNIRLFFIMSCFVSSLGIFITFSRLTILLYLVSFLFLLRKRMRKKYIVSLALLGLTIFVFVPIFFYRFFSMSQIVRAFNFRLDLVEIALSIFFHHPLFGVGLNNFYYFEVRFQKNITPTLLQPVHNVSLLLLSELGISGFLLFCYFLFRTYRLLKDKLLTMKNREDRFYQTTLLVIFFMMITVSLSDHFFVTLQQGQLLSSVLFGLFWKKKSMA